MLRGLVSIHDVMPATRAPVSAMLQALQHKVPALTPAHTTLLVVPGKDWSEPDLHWLQQLADAGHPLAGHGWSHHSPRPRSLYHWCHSLLLSRRAAEHLSRPAPELLQRINACFHWFRDHRLPPPDLYVPPAWAAGCLRLSHWQALPFQQLETLRGVTHLAQGNLQSLPLAGYEADTPLRVAFLRQFNRYQRARAGSTGIPLRISLHPFDLQYGLAHNIWQDLAAVERFISYSQLTAASDNAGPVSGRPE